MESVSGYAACRKGDSQTLLLIILANTLVLYWLPLRWWLWIKLEGRWCHQKFVSPIAIYHWNCPDGHRWSRVPEMQDGGTIEACCQMDSPYSSPEQHHPLISHNSIVMSLMQETDRASLQTTKEATKNGRATYFPVVAHIHHQPKDRMLHWVGCRLTMYPSQRQNTGHTNRIHL